MLSIAFGQSKYFVDNLSENVKRGLRQKLRRGEMPGRAPLGYLNDLRFHTIVPDPKKFELVKRLFVEYAGGKISFSGLRAFSSSIGLFGFSGNALSISMVQRILSNPFYYGAFNYNGELHEGKHEPMIGKKLFEKCQDNLKKRARPKKKGRRDFTYRGTFLCKECGCAITSEVQKKHIYYRCTKKKGPCSQKYLREEELDEQIKTILQKVSLPISWADFILSEIEKLKINSAEDNSALQKLIEKKLGVVSNKISTLLDAHLENLITRDEFTLKKKELVNEKISLANELSSISTQAENRLEPVKNFFLETKEAENARLQQNPSTRRDFIGKIGSNFHIVEKKAEIVFKKEWEILFLWGEEMPVAHRRDSADVPVGTLRTALLTWSVQYLPN